MDFSKDVNDILQEYLPKKFNENGSDEGNKGGCNHPLQNDTRNNTLVNKEAPNHLKKQMGEESKGLSPLGDLYKQECLDKILKWADDNYEEFVTNYDKKRRRTESINTPTHQQFKEETDCTSECERDLQHDWLTEMKSREEQEETKKEPPENKDDYANHKGLNGVNINGYTFLDDCRNVLIEEHNEDVGLREVTFTEQQQLNGINDKYTNAGPKTAKKGDHKILENDFNNNINNELNMIKREIDGNNSIRFNNKFDDILRHETNDFVDSTDVNILATQNL